MAKTAAGESLTAGGFLSGTSGPVMGPFNAFALNKTYIFIIGSRTLNVKRGRALPALVPQQVFAFWGATIFMFCRLPPLKTHPPLC